MSTRSTTRAIPSGPSSPVALNILDFLKERVLTPAPGAPWRGTKGRARLDCSKTHSRTRRSSEREPADSLRDKSSVSGGWLPSLTFPFGGTNLGRSMRHFDLRIYVAHAVFWFSFAAGHLTARYKSRRAAGTSAPSVNASGDTSLRAPRARILIGVHMVAFALLYTGIERAVFRVGLPAVPPFLRLAGTLLIILWGGAHVLGATGIRFLAFPCADRTRGTNWRRGAHFGSSATRSMLAWTSSLSVPRSGFRRRWCGSGRSSWPSSEICVRAPKSCC